MATHTLTRLYRTAYLVGVALLIASMALLWPTAGNVSPASAQSGWFLTVDCTGFDLDAPEHPAVDVRSQVRPPGSTTWTDRQSWSLPAGGPDTYSFTFDAPLASGSEILVRVFESGTNTTLFAEKQDVFCGEPTSTPVTPPPTPTNTTPPEPTPTNTTPPEPTPTNTTPPEPSPTPTNTTPPEISPTPTNTTPPGEPSATPTFTATPGVTISATPTDTGSLPTPTFTPEVPTSTPTDTGSLPTPTNTTPPDRPTSTPGGGGSIPSPVPQGTPGALIPVTGLDTSFNFTFLQRTLMNLGFGFLGLGLVLHGLSLGGRKKDE